MSSEAKATAQLRYILADLYTDASSMRRVIEDAGLDTAMISLGSSAAANWYSILSEAEKTNKVDDLLNAIQSEYSNNSKFQAAYTAYVQTVETHGGTYVAGNIEIGGGDFIYGDSHLYTSYEGYTVGLLRQWLVRPFQLTDELAYIFRSRINRGEKWMTYILGQIVRKVISDLYISALIISLLFISVTVLSMLEGKTVVDALNGIERIITAGLGRR